MPSILIKINGFNYFYIIMNSSPFASPAGAGFGAELTDFILTYDLEEQNERIADICGKYPIIGRRIYGLRTELSNNPELLKYGNRDDLIKLLITESVMLRTSEYETLKETADLDPALKSLVKNCRNSIYPVMEEELESRPDDDNLLHAIGSYNLDFNEFIDNPNKTKAFECFTKAAEKGNFYSKYNLAKFYLKGEVVEKDLAQALSLYYESIKKIDDKPQYREPIFEIAVAYCQYGPGMDNEKAFHIFEFLVNKYKHVESKAFLAEFYLTGLVPRSDIEEDEEEIIGEDVVGIHGEVSIGAAGRALMDDLNIRNHDKAIELLIEADSEGSKRARTVLQRLAIDFMEAEDQPEEDLELFYPALDPNNLLRVLKHLEAKEDSAGLVGMVRIYTKPEKYPAITQDRVKAVEILQQAIKKGDAKTAPVVLNSIAFIARNPEGVDYSKSIELFRDFLEIYQDKGIDPSIIEHAELMLGRGYVNLVCDLSDSGQFGRVTELLRESLNFKTEDTEVVSKKFCAIMYSKAVVHCENKNDTKAALFFSRAINELDPGTGRFILEANGLRGGYGYKFAVYSPQSTPLTKDEIIEFIKNLSQNEEVAKCRIARSDTTLYKNTIVSDVIRFSLKDKDGNDLLFKENLQEIAVELQKAIAVGGGDWARNSSYKNITQFIDKAKSKGFVFASSLAASGSGTPLGSARDSEGTGLDRSGAKPGRE